LAPGSGAQGNYESADDLSLGVLHIGVKARLFAEAGFQTLGDLAERNAEELMQIKSVGRRTVDELVRNHRALREAVLADGSIDWSRYCDSLGLALLPARAPVDGFEFLRSLPSFFASLAAHLEDETMAVILVERICKSPANQKTLEEIAIAASRPVTRERVRQKESKLLRQITDGLLNDTYDSLGIHFHPEFSSWWRRAADALAGIDEIDVDAFVKIIAQTWEVSEAAVVEQLPALVALVSGEPQMGMSFRALANLDSRLFAPGIGDSVKRIPVLKLRIGKDAIRLVEAGLPLSGDIMSAIQSGELQRIGGPRTKRILDHLNLVASCIKDAHVGWRAYQTALSLECFPQSPPDGPLQFASTLPVVIERLLRIHDISLRAADVFRLRSSRNVEERMTLEEASKKLDTYAPTVKRVETVLLKWLNDVLVSSEYWRLGVWLDETWLAWWAEAFDTFQKSGDSYASFVEKLASRWRLTANEMKIATPTLWAVFTGYPNGRRSAYKAVVPALGSVTIGSRIRLQGFRRVH
jgi:hypothetical protein